MLVELIVGIATVLAVLAIGNAVLEKVWKQKENLPWFETIPVSTGIGLVIFSTYAFVLLLLGLGYWYLLCLPLLAAIPLWLSQANPAVEQVKAVKKRISASSIELRAGVGLIALVFVIGFLVALAPPSAARPGPIDWDSLNYHFVIPKTYLAQHSLSSIQFLPYDNWPHSLETFYTIPMSLANSQSAKIVMLFVAFALSLSLFALARKFAKTEYAIIAPLVFFTNFVAIFSLGTGYVDMALAFFVVLSFLCLHSWLASARKNWQLLALSGAFAGFAAGIKLIGLIPLALIGLMAVYYAVKQNKASHLLPFAFFSAVFILPWLLRAYLNFGNLIFPLFYAPLGWVGMSSAGTEYFMSVWQSGALTSGAGRGVVDFLLLPFTLTFNGKFFNGIISPLYFAFLPLFLLSLRKILGFEKCMVAFAAVFAIPWFFLYQDARFLEPVLAIAAVLTALAVAKCSEHFDLHSAQSQRPLCLSHRALLDAHLQVILPQQNAIARFENLGIWVQRVALLAVAIALVIFTLYSAKAVPVAFGLQSENSYLLQTLDTYAPCQFINSNHAVRQVLFYKVEKAYYCNKPFAYSNFYNATAANKGEIVNQLKRDGFTHILYNPRETATSGIRELISPSQLIYTANGLAIYSIP